MQPESEPQPDHATAQVHKAAGNDSYKRGDWASAIDSYTQALDSFRAGGGGDGDAQPLSALPAACLLNRAACWLKVDELDLAIEDCSCVLVSHDGGSAKALFRRGQALARKQQLLEAKADLLQAARLAPKDAKVRQALSEVKEAISKDKFSRGFEQMLEQGGQEVEDGQLEDKGLGWKKIEHRVYQYPVAESQPDHKPAASDFKLGPCLGEGNFCRVHLGTHKPSGEQFAVKVIEKAQVEKLKKRQHKNILNEIYMERDVMKRMHHPNIGRLFYTYQDRAALYFATELVACGELWHKLMDEKSDSQVGLPMSQARFYAAEIVNALTYLRANEIAHRDLKPENLMVTATGHLKLIDFGTAKNLVDTRLNGPEFVGTAEYMAPEVFHNRGRVVDSCCDLWSLGCVVYQLLSGETPFKSGSPYLTFKKANKGLADVKFPSWWPDQATDLVKQLLVADQSARLGSESFGDLKAHAFFDGIDFDTLIDTAPPPCTCQELALQALAAEIIATGAMMRADYVGGDADTRGDTMSLGSDMSPKLWAELHHYLDRRKVLATPAYRSLFADATAAPFLRAHSHGCTGLSSASDFEFKRSLYFVVMAGPVVGRDGNTSTLRQAVDAINDMVPRPRFVVIVGDCVPLPHGDPDRVVLVQSMKETMLGLSVEIPILCAAGPSAEHCELHRGDFGDPYYRFWFGGCIGLVVNDGLLDVSSPEAEHDGGAQLHDHAGWLAQQLSFMKTSGARHLVVFHRRELASVCTADPNDEALSTQDQCTASLVNAMRLAGVRVGFGSQQPTSAVATDGGLALAEVPRKRESITSQPPPIRDTGAHDWAAGSGSAGSGSSDEDSSDDEDPEDVGLLYGRNYPMQLVATRPLCSCVDNGGGGGGGGDDPPPDSPAGGGVRAGDGAGPGLCIVKVTATTCRCLRDLVVRVLTRWVRRCATLQVLDDAMTHSFHLLSDVPERVELPVATSVA
jgi:serine/threonine protein kinase